MTARLRGWAPALLVAMMAAACGTSGASPPRPAADAVQETRAHTSEFYNAAAFAQMRAKAGPSRPVPGARAVIVPHHWVGGHLIIGGVRDLVASAGATRVVVMGPNHIGAGGALVTTSDQDWATPLGRVRADREAVATLAEGGAVTVSPRVLTDEHSMAGLMPALAAFGGGARVVPLAIRPGLRLDEARRLAAALGPLLADPGTVMVVSVDFSHYLPVDVARANDAESIAVLEALDSATAIRFSDEHFDSPGSIATLLETMKAAGAGRFVLRAHTSSAEVLGPTPAGTTTYVSGFFAQGPPTPEAATVAQNEAEPAGASSTR